MTTIEDITKHLNELRRKSALYDSQAGRYVSYAKTMRNIAKQLNDLATDMDPVLKAGGRNQNWAEYVDEMYTKMTAGMHVGADLIQAAYPDMTYTQVQYLITKLKTLPGVSTRKDGRQIFLYVKEV